MAEFLYRNGLAVLRRVREGVDEPPSWMHYDERLDAYVAPGHRMSELRTWAASREAPEVSASPDQLETPLFDLRRPRDYQREALRRWIGNDGRGSVVLPTGAGKTLVAILAIHEIGRGACVMTPTRALVNQWFAQLADAFGADRVGVWYGDEKDVRALTVTTYHSAFTLLERYGSRFETLICDEAHHLSDTPEGEAKGWHDALRIAPAPKRLALTATYPDERDAELRRLIGPIAYRRTIGEMADTELARFALERRFVQLTPAERQRYDSLTTEYEDFTGRIPYRKMFANVNDAWRAFMAATRRWLPARQAFRAYLEREQLVLLAERKVDEAMRILRLFPAERAVLFCGSQEAAERLSRRLAIPMISASTPATERKWILDAIARAELQAVVSVRVLDEGWDVPDAKLGIVLGDNTRGSPRQHLQRLGRLLRRRGDTVASMYEIVAADTYEFFTSQRRRGGMSGLSTEQLGLGV
jgi:superfamily II DNA or RNA helicase